MNKPYLDPDILLPLSDVADMLNTFFELEGEERIGSATPYAWWDRSKKNQDIALPMPDPTLAVPGKPLWAQQVLLHWFGSWRGYEVPLGIPAGDRVDSSGRRLYSKYRPT